MSSGVRIGVIVVAALAGFIVLLEVLERVSPAPEGPRSSSYATSPQGLAAYASVLQRAGHPVRRLRTSVTDDAAPDRRDTDRARPGRDGARRGAGDRRLGALRRAPGGGRRGRLRLARRGDRPRAGVGARRRDRARAAAPRDRDADVEEVRAYEFGAWHELGNTLPVIGPADAPLVVTARSGEGSVALLADVVAAAQSCARPGRQRDVRAHADRRRAQARRVPRDRPRLRRLARASAGSRRT